MIPCINPCQLTLAGCCCHRVHLLFAMQYWLLLSWPLSIFLNKDYLAHTRHPQQTAFWELNDNLLGLDHASFAMRLPVDSLLRPDSIQVFFYTIH